MSPHFSELSRQFCDLITCRVELINQLHAMENEGGLPCLLQVSGAYTSVVYCGREVAGWTWDDLDGLQSACDLLGVLVSAFWDARRCGYLR